MTPAIPDLRQYLTAAYGDEELVTLCADYFRDVYENFAAGMTKTGKILLLLDHCERRELLPNLAAALERDRPEQYRRHFASPVAAPRAPAPPPGRDPRQIFVSHAHEGADFTHRLAADLERNGWRVWIAPDSIAPGEKWAEAINRGLEECGIFVVVLTPAAVASDWVKTETNIAIELAHRHEARFIPLSVADCRPPVLWTAFQRIAFVSRYDTGLAMLLATLSFVGAGSPRPVAPPSPQPGRGDHAPTPAVARAPDPAPRLEPVAGPPAVLTLTSPIRLEMVRIPAGEFLMGSDLAADGDAQDNEQPQHRVHLPDFYIGRVPVTNTQFEAFVKAVGYKTTAEKEGFGVTWEGSRWKRVEGANWHHPHEPETSIAQKIDHPVVQVSWYDTLAFCRWLTEATGQDFRLLTEAEWEKAARGARGRLYPWGDEPPDVSRGNFDWNIGDMTPVDRYPHGATPDYGVLDLAGNVWEWTGSLWGKIWEKPDFGYPYDPKDGREDQAAASDVLKVLRGGSWYDTQADICDAPLVTRAALSTDSMASVFVSPGVLSRSILFPVSCILSLRGVWGLRLPEALTSAGAGS